MNMNVLDLSTAYYNSSLEMVTSQRYPSEGSLRYRQLSGVKPRLYEFESALSASWSSRACADAVPAEVFPVPELATAGMWGGAW